MEERTITITEAEVKLLPLLLKVKLEHELGTSHTAAELEAAARSLIDKARAAFEG